MSALIHIDNRTYSLPADPDPREVAAAVRAAVEVRGLLELQVQLDPEGSPLTLFVNTAEVGVIALDWDGAGAGFFHG